MNQNEYERNERAMLARQLQDVERAPLADRQAARADYAELLAAPDILGERAAWLFAGHYGYGPMVRAREIASSRGNRAAQLGVLLAALECQGPAGFAAQAWKALSADQQEAVNAAIVGAIEEEAAQ